MPGQGDEQACSEDEAVRQSRRRDHRVHT
jgi:hypothetical protein